MSKKWIIDKSKYSPHFQHLVQTSSHKIFLQLGNAINSSKEPTDANDSLFIAAEKVIPIIE